MQHFQGLCPDLVLSYNWGHESTMKSQPKPQQHQKKEYRKRNRKCADGLMDVERNTQCFGYALNKAIFDLARVQGRPLQGARKMAHNYSVIKQEKWKGVIKSTKLGVNRYTVSSWSLHQTLGNLELKKTMAETIQINSALVTCGVHNLENMQRQISKKGYTIYQMLSPV